MNTLCERKLFVGNPFNVIYFTNGESVNRSGTYSTSSDSSFCGKKDIVTRIEHISRGTITDSSLNMLGSVGDSFDSGSYLLQQKGKKKKSKGI